MLRTQPEAYHHIHRKSGFSPPRTKERGYRPAQSLVDKINGTASIITTNYTGRSFDSDPRQIGYSLGVGNEPNVHILELGTPDKFWQSLPADQQTKLPNCKKGFVAGVFKGKPGAPEEKIIWLPIPDEKIPGELDGLSARTSSTLGQERHHGNIVDCRVEKNDLVLTHVSRDADRQLIVINSDGWEKNHPQRGALIRQLDSIGLVDAEKFELSSDGRTLTVYSKLHDAYDHPFIEKVDISSLGVDPKQIYNNPQDRDLSVRLIMPDTLESHECLRRQKVTTFNTQSIRETKNAEVKGWRDEHGSAHLKIEPRKAGAAPIEITYKKQTASLTYSASAYNVDNHQEIAVVNSPLRKIAVSTPQESFEILAKSMQELETSPLFAAQPASIQQMIRQAFEDAATHSQAVQKHTIKITASPPYFKHGPIQLRIKDSAGAKTVINCKDEVELQSNPVFVSQEAPVREELVKVFNNAQKMHRTTLGIYVNLLRQGFGLSLFKAVSQVLNKVYELDNLVWNRTTAIRPRYVLQFYGKRDSRIANGLDLIPTEHHEELLKGDKSDKSIVVTKVLSSAHVVHLNGKNGSKKGDTEVIPLNFDPTEGHPEDYALIVYDSRPDAVYSTRIVAPVATALAPQHLIDPWVMGNELMLAIWPKVDQLGFFGPDMLAAMAFPHGNVFCDPAGNPWYLQMFGSVSHSIFDAKSDAGSRYYFLSGNPITEKMSTGAAMVTGPNTDSINPAREGRLSGRRLPGTRKVVKTIIPGYYILVVEDAEGSYFDMRMFGLKTVTTVLPHSAGGGLDNVNLALIIQRSQRWNAGKAIYTMDGAELMWQDVARGNLAYRFIYNASRGLFTAKQHQINPTSAQSRIKTRAIDPHAPVQKAFKLNEAREWLNVGTWYFVAAAKMMMYLSVPILILLTILPIPVAGSLFLLACLGGTLFGWPFWAAQMAKVGVNPRLIMSFSPVHLFYGDIPMRTMLKAGLDIERLGVGRFRISDRSLGNRITAADKKAAFWIGGVLPAATGLLLLSSWALIFLAPLAVGPIPILIAALPFILGAASRSFLGRAVKRWIPNPNTRSLLKSTAHWAIKNIPLVAGIITTCIISPSLAVFAIPLVTAAMAGGWAVYMGLNIFNELNIYHREQSKVHNLPEPNPAVTIQKHQADTWRNTLREAVNITAPILYENEFTSNNNLQVDPYKLWEKIKNLNILVKPNPNDPVANLNTLISGEIMESGKEKTREIIDLFNIDFNQANQRFSLPHFIRRIRISLLSRKIGVIQNRIKANTLEPNQYERIRERNRLILEDCFPAMMPKRNLLWR